jgi:hypothetical protein
MIVGSLSKADVRMWHSTLALSANITRDSSIVFMNMFAFSHCIFAITIPFASCPLPLKFPQNLVTIRIGRHRLDNDPLELWVLV